MDDLVVFLRARLAEDEQVARGVSTGPNVPEKWTAVQYREGVRPWRIDGQCSLVVEAVCGPDAAHIARHDPARVLAEVEWKSALVDLCANVMSGREVTGFAPGNAWTIMTRMANSYRDHPDWKPYWPGSG